MTHLSVMLMADNSGSMMDMCITLSLVNDPHLTDSAGGSGLRHSVDKCIRRCLITEVCSYFEQQLLNWGSFYW